MKDQFHVKGMGTTMGYFGWIGSFEGNKSSELKYRAESELVRKLESLGAIVIAKVRSSSPSRLAIRTPSDRVPLDYVGAEPVGESK
jgi:amidase